ETIDRCAAPVVARVHGYALGGGSGLVACSDVAVAAPDAVFGFTEVKLGIIPAVISPFVLPRIGAHARRYFLTGERFDALTARRIGLVDEVTDELDGAVERVVGELLASGPEAARTAKALVRDRPLRRQAGGPDRPDHPHRNDRRLRACRFRVVARRRPLLPGRLERVHMDRRARVARRRSTGRTPGTTDRLGVRRGDRGCAVRA